MQTLITTRRQGGWWVLPVVILVQLPSKHQPRTGPQRSLCLVHHGPILEPEMSQSPLTPATPSFFQLSPPVYIKIYPASGTQTSPMLTAAPAKITSHIKHPLAPRTSAFSTMASSQEGEGRETQKGQSGKYNHSLTVSHGALVLPFVSDASSLVSTQDHSVWVSMKTDCYSNIFTD